MTNDKLPTFRVELKIFTRFVFKLVFRVSGKMVPQDIPLTSKRTRIHNCGLWVEHKCSKRGWGMHLNKS